MITVLWLQNNKEYTLTIHKANLDTFKAMCEANGGIYKGYRS